MSVSRRLAAHRANTLAQSALATNSETPETEPNDGGESGAEGKKEEIFMTEEEHKAAVAQAHDAGKKEGFAEANDRFAAVIGSEHYAGREGLAHKMLGNVKLGADDIIETLAAAEKKPESQADAGDTQAKAEEAGRKEMQKALAETGNSDIEPNGGGKGTQDKAQEASNIWGSAIAKVFPNKG